MYPIAMQISAKPLLAVLFLIVFSMVSSPVLADTREQQVQIESKIVEVNNSQARELGVDWNQRDSETSDMRSLEHLGQPGNFAQTKSAFDFIPLDFSAPQSKPAVPKVLSTPTKILSEPQLEVQNNQQVKISTPLVFSVVPQIQNDGRINLIFAPEIASIAPILDGKTSTIGGLIQDEPKEVSKVPVISNIPALGHLFKQESNKSDKKNLLVFVTPTIVQSSDN